MPVLGQTPPKMFPKLMSKLLPLPTPPNYIYLSSCYSFKLSASHTRTSSRSISEH